MNSLPLVPEARPGFRVEDKLREYYKRVLQEWYLWRGNNPFDYEDAEAVRLIYAVSRQLAQLGGIAQGVQPRAMSLAIVANTGQRVAMQRLGWQIRIVVALTLLSLAALLWQALCRRAGSTPALRAQSRATRHAR